MAFELSTALDKITDLGYELSLHTLKLILYSRYRDLNHWREEILTWLNKCKSLNRVKTKSGKINFGRVYNVLYNNWLQSDEDVKLKIDDLVYEYGEPDHEFIKSKLDEKSYKRLHEALSSIYGDYAEYIDGRMSPKELRDRMEEYWV